MAAMSLGIGRIPENYFFDGDATSTRFPPFQDTDFIGNQRLTLKQLKAWEALGLGPLTGNKPTFEHHPG
ncbi:hypothetical protein [Aquiflexum sp.]|uniref:hypothetical protein n=1 Tax=Aquiflexum sp. TaxID=1872584 RepID=UPI0035940B53